MRKKKNNFNRRHYQLNIVRRIMLLIFNSNYILIYFYKLKFDGNSRKTKTENFDFAIAQKAMLTLSTSGYGLVCVVEWGKYQNYRIDGLFL